MPPALTSRRHPFRGPMTQTSLVVATLFLALGCAKVAGFEDLTGAETGGKATGTSTGGSNFVVNQGGTSPTGGATVVVYLTAGRSGADTGGATSVIIPTGGAHTGGAATGGAATGGAATGGTSAAACGGLNDPCCSGQTCTAPNASCNTLNNRCEVCGALNGPCCQSAQRCSNNGCCVTSRCVAEGPNACGNGNQCQASHCNSCGRANLPCCGTGPNSSCEFGLTCNNLGDCT